MSKVQEAWDALLNAEPSLTGIDAYRAAIDVICHYTIRDRLIALQKHLKAFGINRTFKHRELAALCNATRARISVALTDMYCDDMSLEGLVKT